MSRDCHCATCPGYYLAAHPCTCTCHQRRLDALLKRIEDEKELEDAMDVCEPLESEQEAYDRANVP